MTKKDFITVSSVIRACREDTRDNVELTERERVSELYTSERITRALAEKFAAINPRFDFDRFYEACGL